eukprot:scaffold2070_cov242-Prasinococcus_capsulatus_cf.AAC.2
MDLGDQLALQLSRRRNEGRATAAAASTAQQGTQTSASVDEEPRAHARGAPPWEVRVHALPIARLFLLFDAPGSPGASAIASESGTLFASCYSSQPPALQWHDQALLLELRPFRVEAETSAGS